MHISSNAHIATIWFMPHGSLGHYFASFNWMMSRQNGSRWMAMPFETCSDFWVWTFDVVLFHNLLY
jgi:hypothetical protein